MIARVFKKDSGAILLERDCLMKISVFGIPELTLGKNNIKDARLDQADKLVKAKKKTYVQADLVGEEGGLEADAIITLVENRTDLILKDLEFVETRFGRSTLEEEKALLGKLKTALENDQFISSLNLSAEEIQSMSSYNLLTLKPVVLVKKEELENIPELLFRAVKESGFISFFTIGDKENRAWLIKKGTSAWEAAGAIHSDIQKGFIRAEIIPFADFIQAGGETQAKQANKMRLEMKEYVMQDCDLVNFRFNK